MRSELYFKLRKYIAHLLLTHEINFRKLKLISVSTLGDQIDVFEVGRLVVLG